MSKPNHTNTQLPIVVGITGASGAIYAARALQWLLAEGRQVHLVVSPDGLTVIRQELNYSGELEPESIVEFFHAAGELLGENQSAHDNTARTSVSPTESSSSAIKIDTAIRAGCLHVHQFNDYFTPIASGSYRTAGMVVCPCSGTTLSSIAYSNSRNLIHRAAEVHLKERRKLILVPREAPLSLMQIENMLRVTQAGAVVLPAAPGWYHGVHGLGDLVDFVVARILDQLEIPHERVRRWGS